MKEDRGGISLRASGAGQAVPQLTNGPGVVGEGYSQRSRGSRCDGTIEDGNGPQAGCEEADWGPWKGRGEVALMSGMCAASPRAGAFESQP